MNKFSDVECSKIETECVYQHNIMASVAAPKTGAATAGSKNGVAAAGSKTGWGAASKSGSKQTAVGKQGSGKQKHPKHSNKDKNNFLSLSIPGMFTL